MIKGIYKRNNNYSYKIEFHGYKEVRSVGPNKTLARQIWAKRYAEIREAYLTNVNFPIAFNAFAGKYLVWSENNKKPTSYKRDIVSINALKKYFGEMLMRDITITDIENYLLARHAQTSHKTGEAISKATLNRERHCLSAMWREAKKHKYVSANIIREVSIYKEKPKIPEPLNKDELHKLIEVSDGYLKIFILLCAHCGLRSSEALNLEWKNIDWQDNSFRVLETKNDEPRSLFMTEPLIKELKALLPNKSKYVVHGKDDNKFTRLSRSFNTALKKAGLRHIRIHDLRHTYGSLSTRAGIIPQVLMENLGQKSLKMVLRYSHLWKEHKKESVQKFQDLLSS